MSALKFRRNADLAPLFRLRPIVWSVALVCGGLPFGAQATELADVPLAVLKAVQPNLFITLDHSLSMDTYPSEGGRMKYDPRVTYRPWLFDAVLRPPHGPVRFRPANPERTCGYIIEPVYISKYVKNPSGQDYIEEACRFSNATVTATSLYTINVKTHRTWKTPLPPPGALGSNIPDKPPGRTDCVKSTTRCTDGEEHQNYANFLQYYGTRYRMARGALSEVMGRQSYNARIGYAGFGDNLDPIQPMRTIAGEPLRSESSPRFDFYRNVLLANRITAGATGTREALIRVGEYFKGDLPYRDDPRISTSPLRTCRNNYNILITDGHWNVSTHAMFREIGNADANAGAPYADNNGLTTVSTSGGPTLADIAYHYYITDLRPRDKSDVPASINDPANWQHLVNYTVMVGQDSKASIPKESIDKLFAWIKRNPEINPAERKEEAPRVNWPNPIGTEAEPRITARIDDLAHAGLNSRGGYYSANDPEELTQALLAALNDSIGRSTSAPVSINNNSDEPLKEGNIAYVTGYDASYWSGQLRAIGIDPATGFVRFDRTPEWSASLPAPDQRRIITGDGHGGAIPFRGDQLLTGSLRLKGKFNLHDDGGTNPNNGDGGKIIAYLRGVRDNEGLGDGNYRERGSPANAPVLGDIVDSGPTINIPGTQYRHDNDPDDPRDNYSRHAEFRKAQKAKPGAIFVGANDGMLHAFEAATGRESWAYIPSFAWDCTLSGSIACPGKTDPASVTGRDINYLRDMAVPLGFQHRFFVNASPIVTDVDFSNDRGADWRTILTGALGKGGRGVYALDITDPLATGEEDAAGKLLWEFPSRQGDGSEPSNYDPRNMGYVFDQIHVGHVTIQGKRRWVAYVPSGFNNGLDTGGDGKARLFVLDAKTGELIREIVAGANDPNAGTPASPAGMAWLSISMADQGRERSGALAFGGDQLGNLWRFDLTSHNESLWHAEKVAVLRDESGQVQPVTTPPVLSEGADWDETAYQSVKRLFIMVGTGRYLDTTDRPGNPDNKPNQTKAAQQKQSFYVFRDPFQKDKKGRPLEGNLTLDPLRSELAEYRLSAPGGKGEVGKERTFTLLPGQKPPGIHRGRKGFFFDLSKDIGQNIFERVNVPFDATAVAVILPTNAPSADPCDLRGRGSTLTVPLVDIAGFTPGLLMNNGAEPISAGFSLGSLVVTAMTIVRTEDGKLTAVLSTDAPISAADCATLKSKFGGRVQCKENESVISVRLAEATPPTLEPKPTRYYWRDLSTE